MAARIEHKTRVNARDFSRVACSRGGLPLEAPFMTPYSKMAQTAISAISLLAETHDAHRPAKFSSAQIAARRHLPQPVVAKVLTILSQAKMVNGSPGPGGGYWLARPPEAITLFEVISLFDRVDKSDACPFGPDHCGSGPQCPLHDELMQLRQRLGDFLRTNTLAAFVPSRRTKKRTKRG